MASAALVAPKGLMSTAGPLFSQLNTWLSRPAHTVKEPKHLAGVLAVAEAACAQEPPLLMGAGWRIGPARALRRLFKAIARHPLLAPAWADSPYYARIIQVALTCMSGDATFEVICRVLCRVERGEVAGEQFLRLIDPVRAWPRVPANTVYVARHVRSGLLRACKLGGDGGDAQLRRRRRRHCRVVGAAAAVRAHAARQLAVAPGHRGVHAERRQRLSVRWRLRVPRPRHA